MDRYVLICSCCDLVWGWYHLPALGSPSSLVNLFDLSLLDLGRYFRADKMVHPFTWKAFFASCWPSSFTMCTWAVHFDCFFVPSIMIGAATESFLLFDLRDLEVVYHLVNVTDFHVRVSYFLRLCWFCLWGCEHISFSLSALSPSPIASVVKFESSDKAFSLHLMSILLHHSQYPHVISILLLIGVQYMCLVI